MNKKVNEGGKHMVLAGIRTARGTLAEPMGNSVTAAIAVTANRVENKSS